MMGRRKSEQGQLFYAFDLEAVVLGDHQVRRIAAVLDLAWVRTELAPHYFHTGRPSIVPELMVRMLILGYVFAIRSERVSVQNQFATPTCSVSRHPTRKRIRCRRVASQPTIGLSRLGPALGIHHQPNHADYAYGQQHCFAHEMFGHQRKENSDKHNDNEQQK